MLISQSRPYLDKDRIDHGLVSGYTLTGPIK